jgi:hypothetical protein
MVPPGGSALTTRHARAFRKDVEEAFSQVKGHVTYLDTVQVLISRNDIGNGLKYLAKNKITFIPRRTAHPMWPFSIRMHQPPRHVLVDLDQNLSRHLVNRFDVAYDYLFDDLEKARALQHFIAPRITQRWHGKRRAALIEETVYLAGAWKGRGGAVYSHNPSKVAGGPCTHVELRFYSARQTGRWDADSLSGLLRIDPAAILTHECRLSQYDAKHLARSIEEMVNATMQLWRRLEIPFSDRAAAERKVHLVLSRALSRGEDEPIVANLENVPIQVWLEMFPELMGRAIAHVPFPHINMQVLRDPS